MVERIVHYELYYFSNHDEVITIIYICKFWHINENIMNKIFCMKTLIALRKTKGNKTMQIYNLVLV